MFKFETKEQLTKFIQDEILNSSEALDILGCSRQYLNKLVKEGKLIPIKETTRDKLFYKQDIVKRKSLMRK
ncbi:helix-turn-helix transcriptional regulator [Bacillus thuringiensis]|uniref:helix-turn-helix transcriptional regulator n=1 Tax=Bacillus thuringiensis TaxID=1428 RepID=UPI000BEDA8AF|nr:DNA-binding protein [Bacillus thuringiensis]PEE70425.1 DNA-binding protein [Bacillus thuringiensis]PEF88430.1 DNA-binding protein [Bacillus thuringiensis]PES55862.1 DNA-binding protein [Bacillus thuringiensis]PET14980.1 DNA-binding protein [Bacillus thuringiensis]PEV87525.1 DNA-binding protein [Bacillus thuringiensis]